jgi:hypothetical protein
LPRNNKLNDFYDHPHLETKIKSIKKRKAFNRRSNPMDADNIMIISIVLVVIGVHRSLSAVKKMFWSSESLLLPVFSLPAVSARQYDPNPIRLLYFNPFFMRNKRFPIL